MMNSELRNNLIAEIETMEGFFHDLPSGVRERYELDDKPMTVRFGPDVETVFIDENGVNVFNPASELSIMSGESFEDLASHQALDKLLYRGVFRDADDFVETCLKPQAALQLCENYEEVSLILDEASTGMDATAHGISAHWHMSAVQDGNDQFLVKTEMSEKYSPLFKNTVSQMERLQERFSAFFVRPFRAEQNPSGSKSYSGAGSVYFDSNPDASIRGRMHEIDHTTVEPRISPDDPYQAAYLYLTCLSRALNEQDVEPVVSQEPPIRRGAGGYLDMLEETAQNLEAYPDVFPQHVSDGMMRASIAGYERYFEENPKAKPDVIDDLKERMWVLKHKFSEPEGTEVGAEPVV